ncbi:DUF3261 domain-containing protein [Halomonas sp. V046]|uniref:DUF3261 domain-containing protein n=1 Tax=Halomonas sp. V046 TaxID=3459611 RepID=UPI00404485D2
MSQIPTAPCRVAALLPMALLAGLVLALGACSLVPPVSPPPALASLPPAGPDTQRLTFTRDAETRVLIGVLRHDRQRLQLALLSPQGQRLLTLVRDAKGARFLPGAAFDPPFTAEWLASRLSWSLWPEAQLEAAFAGSDWSIDHAGDERRIYRDDDLIARLVMTPTCRVIHDIEADFRLSVSSLGDSADRGAARGPRHDAHTDTDTDTDTHQDNDSPCPQT